MSLLAALRALPTLREFPDDELAVLATVAVEQRMTPGMVLCREGEPGHSCFLVVAGEAEVVRGTADGERVLATLSSGAFIGQIALVDRGPRTATVRALTACVTLELSRETFERLLAACSPLALRFQESVAVAGIRQLRNAMQRLGQLLVEAETEAKVRPRAAPTPAVPTDKTMLYIQTAATEWGVSLDDVKTVAYDGIEPRAARRPR